MRETHLIVNADDFGISRAISDGIILAHQLRLLSPARL